MDDVIDSDLNVQGFSLRTAYYLAYAANYAYEEFGDWIRRLGLGPKTTVFTCGQFHGFFGSLSKVGVLAFRGTQNVGNCLTDAETPLVARQPYPGRVHRGFVSAVEEVWPKVRELLGPAWRSPPLWVTGHSLGGAMATLASVRLANEGYKVRAVYTYGSPRAGNKVFRQSYRLPHYRFVFDNDLVPHLPFRWCYKHVGDLKLLDHDGNLTEEHEDWVEKKQALRRHAKRVQRAHGRSTAHHELTDFDWLADHHLGCYLEGLKRILPQVPYRRRSEAPAGKPAGHPARSHRVDAAVTEVPPPAAERGRQRKSPLSADDLIGAFSNQPSRPLDRPKAGT
jgi:triacylglycerol lipase